MMGKRNEKDLNELFIAYSEDFAECEQTIRKHSKSFYRAFAQLPKQKAWSVFAVYSFCREADDIIDVYNDLGRLTLLEKELTEFLSGNIPDRYFWRALVPVFETYKMEPQAFYDMLTGQKMDWDFQQPETQEQLEEYSYYVAGSVGLMLLPILSNQAEKVKNQGIQLGQAMQITNILRDIGEDFKNQRIYLPKEVMKKYHVTLDTLKHERIDESFIKLWEYEAMRAEKLYQGAKSMISDIDSDCQEALLLSAAFYEGILDAVRKNNYQCFNTRNYVKKSQQLKLYQDVKKQLNTSFN
ncbi:phytoene/squalene synthase family protein [Enterococcus sp. 5H]|uniref:phytoene/squalene synthase family protein n=1 Tax=Enterococcus sp. 5H TaxID=1229490 RepID=UPI002FE155D2|nr:Phytoene synthase [Enterococcus sp. 5H]